MSVYVGIDVRRKRSRVAVVAGTLTAELHTGRLHGLRHLTRRVSRGQAPGEAQLCRIECIVGSHANGNSG